MPALPILRYAVCMNELSRFMVDTLTQISVLVHLVIRVREATHPSNKAKSATHPSHDGRPAQDRSYWFV
jgi:hypothetical protein